MIFWRKKQTENLRTEEYEILSKKIIGLADDVADYRRQTKLLETEINNLRGQFNRKL